MWSIGQFPELDHLDPAQRAQLLRQVPWWIYPLIILRAMIGAACFVLIVTALAWQVFSPDALTIASLIVGVGTFIALYREQLQRIRKTMRKEIILCFEGQRPPFCFACGYDLRETTAKVCPECGHATGGHGQ